MNKEKLELKHLFIYLEIKQILTSFYEQKLSP
jgi:hypothetical protein